MRRYRDAPYASDAARSKARKMARPKDLLAWFLAGYREEVPSRLHTAGVWRDARRRGDDEEYEPVGGSQLGSPRMADTFRSYVEDDAFVVETAEYEGHRDIRTHYRTPMRAALARLAGRGAAHDPYGYMGRMLYRLALNDGNLASLGWPIRCDCPGRETLVGLPEPVRKPYLEAALHRLYDRYHEEPPTYTMRTVTDAVA